MSQKKVQRDRLNAYVMPGTTKEIERIKKEKLEELGIKLTIGQCVDIMANSHKNERGG